MRKISSLLLGVAFTVAGYSQSAPPIEDVLISGNQATQTLFINHIHTFDEYSTNMRVGRINAVRSGTNNYLFGYSNEVDASNTTVVGYRNNIQSGQSGSIFGKENTVGGQAPMLLGYRNYMDEYTNKSIAIGRENNIYGASTIALGTKNYVDGSFSSSIGSFNEANANKATALGTYNRAYSEYSAAIGSYNYTYGVGAVSIGHSNRSNADFSYAFGYGITNDVPSSVMLGTNNSSKLTILSSGRVGIGTVAPNKKFEITVPYGVTDGMRIGYPGSTTEGLDIQYLNTGATNIYFDSRYNNDAAAMLFRMKTNGTAVNALTILGSGKVLIGTPPVTTGNYLLNISGNVRANKMVVNTTGADFVFDSSYRLAPLTEVEAFIKQNSHLPGIAPAREMQQDGMDMGDQQTKLLQKVEELTLYLIQQAKEIELLKKQLSEKKKKGN